MKTLVVTQSDSFGSGPWRFITSPFSGAVMLQSFQVQIITDATVANRELLLTFKVGSQVLLDIYTGLYQTATQSVSYNFGVGLGGVITAAHGGLRSAPLPDAVFPAGTELIVTLTDGVAGDRFIAPCALWASE